MTEVVHIVFRGAVTGVFSPVTAAIQHGGSYPPHKLQAAVPPQKGANMSQLTYSRAGDYLLLDIKLNEPPPELTKPLGRYGQLRQKFLREHREITYSALLLSEQLYPHLRGVDETAMERRRRGMPEDIILSELVYE